VDRDVDYITSTSTHSPVRVSPPRPRTLYEGMDYVIQCRVDGIDAILLLYARSISYISVARVIIWSGRGIPCGVLLEICCRGVGSGLTYLEPHRITSKRPHHHQ